LICRSFAGCKDLWESLYYKFTNTRKKDALSLLDTGIAQTRQRKRSVGAGKNKTTVIDLWRVVGIEQKNLSGGQAAGKTLVLFDENR
jgi:hypothetical protein